MSHSPVLHGGGTAVSRSPHYPMQEPLWTLPSELGSGYACKSHLSRIQQN